MISRYGYFIAPTKALYGNPELAVFASNLWDGLGINVHDKTRRVEGVSIWERDGMLTARLVTTDFFTGRVVQAVLSFVNGHVAAFTC